MKVCVTLEQRFFECNGNLFTEGAFDSHFWQRYLKVFSKVVIAARALKVDEINPKWSQVNNDQIEYYPLPYYVGLKAALLRRGEMKKALDKLASEFSGAFILRVGSPIADILAPKLRRLKKKYAVEVVGDPWDVFAPGAISHPLRAFLRLYFSLKLKAQCKFANYSSYVTAKALQDRYPPINSKKSINASSIELHEEFFHTNLNEKSRNNEWVFVGTLEQYQKAPDVLLKAFAKLVIDFPQAKLTFIGDGRERGNLELLAQQLNISKSVTFLGKLKNSNAVREHYLNSTYFVLPSRGEGLPRAMIEAMACGCACIGSNIGGIRELIEEKYIAQVNDVDLLAKRMKELMSLNDEQIKEVQKRNMNEAKSYLAPILEQRRTSLYQFIENDLGDDK